MPMSSQRSVAEPEIYLCWERFRDLLNACPHHGYETWRIISFFYESLAPKMRQFVEMMCNGELLNKDPDEAFDYFDLLADNVQSWDTIDTSNRSRASTNPFGGGKYQYREDDDSGEARNLYLGGPMYNFFFVCV